MIWHTRRADGSPVDTTTCPVLVFTPEVDSALRWFDATHEQTMVDGRARWQRTGWPRPGGVWNQDARTVAMLTFLRHVHDDLLKVK